jgi:hypothetical protein
LLDYCFLLILEYPFHSPFYYEQRVCYGEWTGYSMMVCCYVFVLYEYNAVGLFWAPKDAGFDYTFVYYISYKFGLFQQRIITILYLC